MVTDDNPPGAKVDVCRHRVPVTVDCDRCDQAAEAAQVGRPPSSGPASVRLVVAKHTMYCLCNRFVIAFEDKVGRVDGVWRCEDCVRAAAEAA